jgi:hypothetical protein
MKRLSEENPNDYLIYIAENHQPNNQVGHIRKIKIPQTRKAIVFTPLHP